MSVRLRALLALAALLPAAPAARAQVSPGPLSKPHAALEGNLNCVRCHGSGGTHEIDRGCLDCHREIGRAIDQRRGLHGKEARDGCARCHPEHGGRAFDLVQFEEGSPERFDHRRAGWPLEGKHARVRCAECHGNPRFRTSPLLRLAPGRSEGWLGLEARCDACHADVHRGALGTACDRCHAPSGWRGARVDHDRTAFPLRGKHRDVPCAKCHEAAHLDLPRDAQGGRVPLFKPLPHADCDACHRDPHAGRLGAACARCHDPAGFREVPRAAFDHDRTRFALTGAHARVACAKCHEPRPGERRPRPAFAACADCHADPHAGQATLAGRRVDCAACHETSDWKRSTFTAARHAATDYPLLGKHAQVACAKCHREANARVRFRPPHAACADCHAPAHGAQLGPDGARCERCHEVAGWTPARFGSAEHARLALPLEGRHAQAPCAACHRPVPGRPPAVPAGLDLGPARVFLRAPADCGACHRDAHDGRFAAGGERAVAGGCATCHTSAAFRPSRVDPALHARFAYPLEGAHATVPCSACHADLRSPPAAGRPLTLREPRRRCADCHADVHGGQFAARVAQGDCAACHGLAAFRPATRFDHDRDTRFRLAGAHRAVPCARCHAAAPGADGRPLVRYVGTPRRCADCHSGKEPPREP